MSMEDMREAVRNAQQHPDVTDSERALTFLEAIHNGMKDPEMFGMDKVKVRNTDRDRFMKLAKKAVEKEYTSQQAEAQSKPHTYPDIKRAIRILAQNKNYGYKKDDARSVLMNIFYGNEAAVPSQELGLERARLVSISDHRSTEEFKNMVDRALKEVYDVDSSGQRLDASPHQYPDIKRAVRILAQNERFGLTKDKAKSVLWNLYMGNRAIAEPEDLGLERERLRAISDHDGDDAFEKMVEDAIEEVYEVTSQVGPDVKPHNYPEIKKAVKQLHDKAGLKPQDIEDRVLLMAQGEVPESAGLEARRLRVTDNLESMLNDAVEEVMEESSAETGIVPHSGGELANTSGAAGGTGGGGGSGGPRGQGGGSGGSWLGGIFGGGFSRPSRPDMPDARGAAQRGVQGAGLFAGATEDAFGVETLKFFIGIILATVVGFGMIITFGAPIIYVGAVSVGVLAIASIFLGIDDEGALIEDSIVVPVWLLASADAGLQLINGEFGLRLISMGFCSLACTYFIAKHPKAAEEGVATFVSSTLEVYIVTSRDRLLEKEWMSIMGFGALTVVIVFITGVDAFLYLYLSLLGPLGLYWLADMYFGGGRPALPPGSSPSALPAGPNRSALPPGNQSSGPERAPPGASGLPSGRAPQDASALPPGNQSNPGTGGAPQNASALPPGGQSGGGGQGATAGGGQSGSGGQGATAGGGSQTGGGSGGGQISGGEYFSKDQWDSIIRTTDDGKYQIDNSQVQYPMNEELGKDAYVAIMREADIGKKFNSPEEVQQYLRKMIDEHV